MSLSSHMMTLPGLQKPAEALCH